MRSKGVMYLLVAAAFAAFVTVRPDLQGFRSVDVLRIFSAGLATGVLLSHGLLLVWPRRRGGE